MPTSGQSPKRTAALFVCLLLSLIYTSAATQARVHRQKRCDDAAKLLQATCESFGEAACQAATASHIRMCENTGQHWQYNDGNINPGRKLLHDSVPTTSPTSLISAPTYSPTTDAPTDTTSPTYAPTTGSPTNTACTATSCDAPAYTDASERLTNQLSVDIPQDRGSAGSNLGKVTATLRTLVENDGMMSMYNGGQSFQMHFEPNVGNKFNVTGCNRPTGMDCSETVFQTDAGTGGWGGSCTCPDGQVYFVGDNGDSCGSLACGEGTPGQCNQAAGKWSGNKVWCAASTASGQCAIEVTTNFRACPESQNSPVSDCGECTYGHGLLAQSVKLLTDIPACHTWFVKADAVIRSMTSHMRTFWLTDRINLCKRWSANEPAEEQRV